MNSDARIAAESGMTLFLGSTRPEEQQLRRFQISYLSADQARSCFTVHYSDCPRPSGRDVQSAARRRCLLPPPLTSP